MVRILFELDPRNWRHYGKDELGVRFLWLERRANAGDKGGRAFKMIRAKEGGKNSELE